MRLVLLSIAMARTQQVSLLPPRVGIVNRVLMQVGISDRVEHFAGSFYGVSAKLELNMRTRVAIVHLTGAPLGGRVSGTGWLKQSESESGVVVLERSFEKRLRRRFVSIHSAKLNRETHTVIVGVKIPVVGVVNLVLT